MGVSRGLAQGFVDMGAKISEGKIITLTVDPLRPNAPTSFEKFVDDILVPAYKNAA
jgi:hypothetical protein